MTVPKHIRENGNRPGIKRGHHLSGRETGAREGGLRDRTLPDFFIGAHAQLKTYRILTRDPRRYRVHFPALEIVAPDTHP
jgi:predicted nucleic acid-binding protein